MPHGLVVSRGASCVEVIGGAPWVKVSGTMGRDEVNYEQEESKGAPWVEVSGTMG